MPENQKKEQDNVQDQEEKKYQKSSSTDDGSEPDMILDIPNLKVGEINMDVENLKADVSVKAQLANFVNIEVGTKINIEKVKLEIKEVDAEAQLKVRLNRIQNILLKTLQSLDNNPALLKNMIQSGAEGLKDAGKGNGKQNNGKPESKVTNK